MKQTAAEIGKRGETAVCAYLLQQGYQILERNYRVQGGEIDIIAQREEILAFVEVKTRKATDVSPLLCVQLPQRKRIVRASLIYCTEYNADWRWQPRYDAAAVVIDRGRIVSVEYVENAFDADGWM